MADDLTDRQALLVLNALPGIGPITLNRLLAEFGGDPRGVLRAGAGCLKTMPRARPEAAAALARWRDHFDLAREEQQMARSGADFITPRDDGYPPALREIHDPPIGLYRLGHPVFDRPGVAIVGSRRATLYGTGVAKRLGTELARLGFCVVSGMARGIDTAAHEGALSAGGLTAAVLGTGIDLVYPPENLRLYRRIAESGTVLSEFPLGRRADRQSFPMRNRVVSGICQAVVVVESGEKGGAMITARFAGEQGRIVFAVPGRIDQRTSEGCHQLIRDGAVLLTGVDDLLQELNYLRGLSPSAVAPAPRPSLPPLPPDEARTLQCFRGGEMPTPDELAARSGLPAPQVAAALMMLELKGLVAKRADGSYEAA